jgi:hypothetical protein
MGWRLQSDALSGDNHFASRLLGDFLELRQRQFVGHDCTLMHGGRSSFGGPCNAAVRLAPRRRVSLKSLLAIEQYECVKDVDVSVAWRRADSSCSGSSANSDDADEAKHGVDYTAGSFLGHAWLEWQQQSAKVL